MDSEIIKLQVVNIISKLFPNQYIDFEVLRFVDLLDDLGMDSVIFISIVVEIETHFDIIVPDDMLLLENFRCVDDIVLIVKKELIKKHNEEAKNVKT